jgi:hypothetical protein
VRRTELVQLQATDLPVDVIAQPFVRVVPLKGARASAEGRIAAPPSSGWPSAPRRTGVSTR